MKKRKRIFISCILIIMSLFMISFVFAGSASFNSCHAPWEYLGLSGASGTHNPILIASNLNPGDIIKISNLQGNLCVRAGAATGGCGVSHPPTQCAIVQACNIPLIDSADTTTHIAIGFYNNQGSTHTKVSEYALISYQNGNGIVVPAGANAAYGFLREYSGIADYWDNNEYYGSCIFDYAVTPGCTRNCTNKNCGPDGCGGTCGTCAARSCLATSTNTNVVLNKPVTATSSYAGHPASYAIDGNPITYWGTDNWSPATLTIDLQTEQLISNYSIACGGIAHGNKGTINFYNSADAIVATNNYVCDLQGTSSGLTGIFSPAINVKKIVINAQSNGGEPVGDWINIGEFQAWSGCNRVANCAGKTCTDSDGCGGICRDCIPSCIVNNVCSAEGKCVSLANNCPENQTIMKLYQSTNSLGALWNDTPYTYGICYNQIFGETYTEAKPNDCNGANKIINLQQNTGSLGEVPNLNNYNIPVCYGNLVCHNETSSGDGCNDTNEKIVVRLNNDTNSLISNASDTNFPIKICCRKSALENSSWENMNSIQITGANISDSVKLVVKGEVQGRDINYTVYKQCSGLGCIAAFFFGDKKMAQLPSRGYAVWKTTETGSFYFIAQIIVGNSVIKEINSLNEPNSIGILTVSGNDNSFPATRIIKPVNETSYVLNYIIAESRNSTNTISYEQISSDEDDDLNATWNFGDGNATILGNCLSEGNCNATHSYTSTGTKLISLNVKEITRTQQARDFSRIYVYKKGLNIFSIIDEPNYKIPIKGGGLIRINGGSSHVANCSIDSTECNAAATALGKGPCYQVNDTIVPSLNLWCYKHALSSQLNFTWTFDVGRTNLERVKNTDNQAFDEPFTESGDHIIKLKVTYTY